ncbi:Uncharacterized protein TCM_040983 [Theobroma cacao]|uniref:Uncharacterized protein n=1 Tax=Theobroma cacao TaxID=3641 RepID=A0A061GUW2_THECC|nr:Uncharacterized protein TCM_040983 [Theobroma cacao]
MHPTPLFPHPSCGGMPQKKEGILAVIFMFRRTIFITSKSISFFFYFFLFGEEEEGAMAILSLLSGDHIFKSQTCPFFFLRRMVFVTQVYFFSLLLLHLNRKRESHHIKTYFR